MLVLVLCEFGLKTPIHAPLGESLGVKIGVGGNVLQCYPSRNANTWDSRSVKQVA